MKVILSLLMVLVSLIGFTQELNNLGKIEVYEIPLRPDHRVEKINGEFKVVTDSFRFDGNTYFSTPAGFITSLIIFDDQKDYIKQYNSDGKLLVTILSDRIINLKVTENGNKLAFHNSEYIIRINLNTYEADTLKGSYVYEFINDELVYYNPDNETIYYKNQQIKCKDHPNQFLEIHGKVLVITKKTIYELVGNSLMDKYQFNGEFFDARKIGKELYFVDKEEKRKSESFSLYKTSDFKQYILVDRLDELNR